MDFLINKHLPIIHLANHFHTNTDTYLLFSFAKIHHKSRLIDLGCNNGALMILSSIYQPQCIHGVEIIKESVHCAIDNLKMNGIEGKVFHQDIATFKSEMKYDVILCNPPYFDQIHTDNPFDNARHQHTLSLDELLYTIHHLLENKGRAYIIYPSDCLAIFIAKASQHYLRVSRLKLFQSNYSKASNVALIECMLGTNSTTLVEPVMTYQDLMKWKEMMNLTIINMFENKGDVNHE